MWDTLRRMVSAIGRRASTRLDGWRTIAVAMGVMNVATYGFTIIAARLLGPRDFGAFAP